MFTPNPGQPQGSPYGYTQENLNRYNEILQGYQKQQAVFNQQSGQIAQSYQDMLNTYMGQGESQRVALGQQYARQAADTQQSMISRGLGNTTLLDTAQRGVGYDYANSQIALNDTLARGANEIQMAGLGYLQNAQQGYAGLVGNQLGFQGQAFGQKYGAEAQYGFQSLLGQEAYGYNKALAQQSAGNQQYLQQLQNQQAMQMQRSQQSYGDYMQQKYGYY